MLANLPLLALIVAMSAALNLLYLTGIFSLALGILHFTFPLLFDFRGAIPENGTPLKPFPLIITRYNTSRQDIRGLVWVMNIAASFAIVTVGLLDLFWNVWLPTSYGALIAVWIALFWFLRAASQLFMGRRWGDWVIIVAFAFIGAMHLLVAINALQSFGLFILDD